MTTEATEFDLQKFLSGRTIDAGIRDGVVHAVTERVKVGNTALYRTACGKTLNGNGEILAFKQRPLAISCESCQKEMTLGFAARMMLGNFSDYLKGQVEARKKHD